MLHLRFLQFNACDCFVVLGFLYFLQDVLYPPGVINQAIQLLMILWAFIESVKYIINFKHTPRLLNIVSLLVAMYTLYGVLYMLYVAEVHITEAGSRYVGTYLYLQNALNSLLPFYLLYSFACQNKLTAKRLRIYCIVFLTLFVVMYFNLTKWHFCKLLLRVLNGKSLQIILDITLLC